MGYYSGNFYNNNQQPKRRSPILLCLVSAIIGGLITLLFVPLLNRIGYFDNTEQQPQDIINPYTTSKTTSVKVNSQITEAVNKVSSAVVGVENIGSSDDPFSSANVKQGTGSGIIFQRNGSKALVVTNFHVIEGNKKVQVVVPLSNDKSKTVQAKVLGYDRITDLAVLEINSAGVTEVAQFGNSDTLQAGEPAIAIGNPLGPQFSQSVTVGVISSPKRTIDVTETTSTDVIQTDAAINPGNSGGALVNAAGQVIGINSLKIAESGVEGLGFAIPANDAQPVIQQLIRKGHVPRPYLGVQLYDLQEMLPSAWEELKLPSAVQTGVLIKTVDVNTPAARAGVKSRDVIVKIDNQAISNSSELRKYLYKKKIGDTVQLTMYRNGKQTTVSVTLAESPRS
ncbi:S1C family serine protease [Shimazuella kribbensis]|uniref:S1C family serine protease n=1 Tax=Shimazuella kribbensis TaxID=139808 RepID=UPI000401BC9D|nr:S1C family serine protease [Shimazuella kribbensis]